MVFSNRNDCTTWSDISRAANCFLIWSTELFDILFCSFELLSLECNPCHCYGLLLTKPRRSTADDWIERWCPYPPAKIIGTPPVGFLRETQTPLHWFDLVNKLQLRSWQSGESQHFVNEFDIISPLKCRDGWIKGILFLEVLTLPPAQICYNPCIAAFLPTRLLLLSPFAQNVHTHKHVNQENNSCSIEIWKLQLKCKNGTTPCRKKTVHLFLS